MKIIVFGILSIIFVTFALCCLIDVPRLSDFEKGEVYKVTAYCPCEKCCGIYSDGITASEYRLRKGNKLCAANFDFCTVLKIPGYGIVPVLDRGGAIKENCVDVYFGTHQEALEWGVQYLKVKVLK